MGQDRKKAAQKGIMLFGSEQDADIQFEELQKGLDEAYAEITAFAKERASEKPKAEAAIPFEASGDEDLLGGLDVPDLSLGDTKQTADDPVSSEKGEDDVEKSDDTAGDGEGEQIDLAAIAAEAESEKNAGDDRLARIDLLIDQISREEDEDVSASYENDATSEEVGSSIFSPLYADLAAPSDAALQDTDATEPESAKTVTEGQRNDVEEELDFDEMIGQAQQDAEAAAKADADGSDDAATASDAAFMGLPEPTPYSDDFPLSSDGATDGEEAVASLEDDAVEDSAASSDHDAEPSAGVLDADDRDQPEESANAGSVEEISLKKRVQGMESLKTLDDLFDSSETMHPANAEAEEMSEDALLDGSDDTGAEAMAEIAAMEADAEESQGDNLPPRKGMLKQVLFGTVAASILAVAAVGAWHQLAPGLGIQGPVEMARSVTSGAPALSDGEQEFLTATDTTGTKAETDLPAVALEGPVTDTLAMENLPEAIRESAKEMPIDRLEDRAFGRVDLADVDPDDAFNLEELGNLEEAVALNDAASSPQERVLDAESTPEADAEGRPRDDLAPGVAELAAEIENLNRPRVAAPAVDPAVLEGLNAAIAGLKESLTELASENAELRDVIADMQDAAIDREIKISDLERRIRGQMVMVAEIGVLKESVEQTQVVLLDMSSRVSSVESQNPADRSAVNAALTDLERRIDGLSANMGILARMAVSGQTAIDVPGTSSADDVRTAPGGSGASSVFLSGDVPTRSAAQAPLVPASVQVDDFVEGYGYVIDIVPAQGGRKLVIMENGSALVPVE